MNAYISSKTKFLHQHNFHVNTDVFSATPKILLRSQCDITIPHWLFNTATQPFLVRALRDDNKNGCVVD